MTAPRRPRPLLPDPAADAWWDARDLLDTIAYDATQLALAARTTRDRFQAGDDPDIDALAAALGRWLWQPRSLDVVRDAVTDAVCQQHRTTR